MAADKLNEEQQSALSELLTLTSSLFPGVWSVPPTFAVHPTPPSVSRALPAPWLVEELVLVPRLWLVRSQELL